MRGASMYDDFLYRLSQSSRARRVLTPLARAYLRFAPGMLGKESLWNRVVNPYLAWQPHPFIARTRFGRRLAGNTRDMIQQYVYFFGLWEPQLTDWISQRLRPGDTFIDVGANIGYYSLLASKLVGKGGSVVAIEASPAIFRELEANLFRNRVTNVRAVNVAASDCRGKVRLFRGPEHNFGETSLFEVPGSKAEGEVDSAPLGEILKPGELEKARVIKIDVEGAEGAVLPGFVPLLNSSRSDLEMIVEFHPHFLTEAGKSADELVRRLTDVGFQACRLRNDYWPLEYFRDRGVKAPEPLLGSIRDETVIVLSRAKATAR
jgi:FkbM family methyltransferase